MAKRRSAQTNEKVAAAVRRVPVAQELRVGSIRAPLLEISRLRIAIEELTKLIASQTDPASPRGKPALRLRQTVMSDEQARTKIKAYFEARHGETVYPSDVADEFNLDYDRTLRLINELLDDGQVARI